MCSWWLPIAQPEGGKGAGGKKDHQPAGCAARTVAAITRGGGATTTTKQRRIRQAATPVSCGLSIGWGCPPLETEGPIANRPGAGWRSDGFSGGVVRTGQSTEGGRVGGPRRKTKGVRHNKKGYAALVPPSQKRKTPMRASTT